MYWSDKLEGRTINHSVGLIKAAMPFFFIWVELGLTSTLHWSLQKQTGGLWELESLCQDWG